MKNNPGITIIKGPTGSGKTKLAHDIAKANLERSLAVSIVDSVKGHSGFTELEKLAGEGRKSKLSLYRLGGRMRQEPNEPAILHLVAEIAKKRTSGAVDKSEMETFIIDEVPGFDKYINVKDGSISHPGTTDMNPISLTSRELKDANISLVVSVQTTSDPNVARTGAEILELT